MYKLTYAYAKEADMDFSIEMLELIFNATEGLGIVLLGDENVFYKTFERSNIDMSPDGDGIYFLSTKEDGIMCSFKISNHPETENYSVLKFDIDEDIEKFEFLSMIVGIILKNNSIVRMKKVAESKMKEAISSLEEETYADEDNEWI